MIKKLTPIIIALMALMSLTVLTLTHGQIINDRYQFGPDAGSLTPWTQDVNAAGFNFSEVNDISFEDGGTLSWNPTEKTVDVDTGLGPIIQVGYEDVVLVYNDTGSTLYNGKAIYPVGSVAGVASVAYANASDHTKIVNDIAVLTMDIEDGETGLATVRGRVRDWDTSHLVAGSPVYLDVTDGNMTATRPEFPNYTILVGGCSVSDASVGVLNVQMVGAYTDTTQNFWNGIIRESFDFLITSNGTDTITGSLSPSSSLHENLTLMFSDGYTVLDATPAATVEMTAGTQTVPVINYVYIPQSTKVLTVATDAWPTTEHIKVAKCVLQTEALTASSGALRNQNYNDHLQGTDSGQGHLSHIGNRIRYFNATYSSGIALTLKNQAGSVINTTQAGTAIELVTTAGVVMQMHEQTWPAFDMYTTATDDAHIVNQVVDEGGAYSVTTDLVTDITVYADGTDSGTAIGVNKYFNLVIWGVMNKTGEASHIMINIPTGQYTISENAVADVSGTAVYDIPEAYKGVGFLIARLTFQLASGWTYVAIEDLRGQIPSISAGVGVSTTAHDLLSNLAYANSGHTGFLASDGSTPVTANWDIGNYDLTLKSLTGDGTVEGATLTEGGNAVYNATETPGGELGNTWASPTLDDNIIDEANLKLETAPTNDYVLMADSTQNGGMKWAEVSGSGDSWGDAVDADILPTGADNTYDLGSAAASFAEGWFDSNVIINGYVGVGLAAPTVPIQALLGGTVVAPRDGTVLGVQYTAESTSSARLAIIGGYAGYSVIDIGEPNDNDVGGIIYNHSTDTLGFKAAASSNRLYVNSSAVTVAANSNLLINAAAAPTALAGGIAIKNGTANTGNSADTATLYTLSGELWAEDGGGTATQLTANTDDFPSDMAFDPNFPYVTVKKNAYAGIRTYVSEHKIAYIIQQLAWQEGLLNLNEYLIKHVDMKPSELRDWDYNEDLNVLAANEAIAKWEAAQLNPNDDDGLANDPRPNNYTKRPKKSWYK